ncbi:Venom phosphodiesterase [Arachis hypogaea]|nr:Venom phosphodiesterase [Arachis hypogaea]
MKEVPTAAILRRADVYFIQSQERYYNSSVPFEDRVDAILSYVDLPSDEIPDFMTLYLEDPDHQGHKVGADDPQITEADSRIDKMIGWLFSGLEQRGIFYDVTIIMVGDHGMVTTCDKKQIFSNDLAPWINVLDNWVISHTPLLAIMPPSGYSPLDVVAKMNQGLSFGKFENGKHLKLEEGFKVKQKRSKNKECGGSHGYDNEFFSMRSIFIGHGPQFARGRKILSFENVQIYNLVTFILSSKGAPNNSSASFAKDVLLSAA